LTINNFVVCYITWRTIKKTLNALAATVMRSMVKKVLHTSAFKKSVEIGE